MATQPDYPLLTAEEFLEIDFGPDRKAELDNGVIHMIAGGTARHVRVQGNIIATLGPRLRGSGYALYGSILATRTHDLSVRYPDVSIYRGKSAFSDDDAKALDDPHMIFEVLSAGTARTDLPIKLDEYKALPSVDTIVFVDIATERLRVVQRTGPNAWSDTTYNGPVDVSLPALAIDLTHADIFARD